MNCFNNNVPKLSASEHLCNKGSKTLYKSKVLEYKKGLYKKRLYNKNITFNRNGTIKTTPNYNAKQNITRGYYLTNCNDESKTDSQATTINTGSTSIYNKFDGSKGCPSDCSSGFPVLYSKGYGPSAELKVVGPSANVINKFATYPMDGNHIIIDPSNNLFGTNDCKKKYLQYTSYDEGNKCNKNTQQNYMRHSYRNSVGNVNLHN